MDDLNAGGLGFLALAVVCSLGIGAVFKVAAARAVDRLGLLTVNYAAALVIGMLLDGASGLSAVPAGAHALGVGTGALFIVGFFLYATATEKAGLSIAVGVMRLSVAVPFLASWMLWSEVPSWGQGAGLLLAGGAFVLMALRDSGDPGDATERAASHGVLLTALFVVGGCVDTLLKVFSETYGAAVGQAVFLSLVFGTAAGIGAVLMGVRRARGGAGLTLGALGYGAVLGVVNYASAAFLIEAIRRLPGPFVFPANSIAVVLGGALLGVLVWHERLGPRARLGLALAAAALLLLGVG